MTQTPTNGGFNVPAEEPLDTIGLQGSMQQILQDNIGSYVAVEFLIGTQNLVLRQGLLYSVGAGFVVLYDEAQDIYQVCDVFSVKFVTFYKPGHRPGQVPGGESQAAEPTQPTFGRASQAAYSYVQARSRK